MHADQQEVSFDPSSAPSNSYLFTEGLLNSTLFLRGEGYTKGLFLYPMYDFFPCSADSISMFFFSFYPCHVFVVCKG